MKKNNITIAKVLLYIVAFMWLVVGLNEIGTALKNRDVYTALIGSIVTVLPFVVYSLVKLKDKNTDDEFEQMNNILDTDSYNKRNSGQENGKPVLIKCPVCGREVSSQADFCPNCGQPIAGTYKRKSVSEGIEADYSKHGKRGYPALTILLLIFMWPIGLIVMWATGTFMKKTRIIVTAFFACVFLITVISVEYKMNEINGDNNLSYLQEAAEITTEVITTEMETETVTSGESDNYDYRTMVENVIKEAIPDAKFTWISGYRTWTVDSFVMVENKFEVNDVKHTYVARCGAGKIFHLAIDDEVVYYDEDGQWEFMMNE